VCYFPFVRLGWFALCLFAAPAAAAPIAHSDSKPADEPTPLNPKLDPKDLATLTADPITGKANRVDGDEMTGVVAFTFDDGPNPKTTPDVIDALEKYNVPATFFIVTQRIVGKLGARSRDILARELADGFMIGDHSVTHPNLGKATGKTLEKEIDGSIRTLAVQANRPIGMFRPPYGALSPAGRVHLKQVGLTEVQWSIDTLDWASKNPERLRKKTVTMILKQNGGVVLMHDVKPITAKVISEILDDLEAENCRRLGDKKEPIIPVSLHYFFKDGKAPRAIPDDVKQRTEAYRKALPDRCAKRPPPVTPPVKAEKPAPKHASNVH
jgi:peptidoglycan/xylan/chitin deacetylase (PgdA/CDA1 family)